MCIDCLGRVAGRFFGLAVVSVIVATTLTAAPATPGAKSSATNTKTTTKVAVPDSPTSAADAEAHLAADSIAYLVLNLKAHTIEVRLCGVAVKECPFKTDDDDNGAFVHDWYGDGSPQRHVERIFMFRASKILDQEKLSIVAEATKASQDLIQRYVPGRMMILLDSGERIEVLSDADGQEAPFWDRFWERTKWVVASLLGNETLVIHLSGNDAMAVYGVCMQRPALLLIN